MFPYSQSTPQKLPIISPNDFYVGTAADRIEAAWAAGSAVGGADIVIPDLMTLDRAAIMTQTVGTSMSFRGIGGKVRTANTTGGLRFITAAQPGYTANQAANLTISDILIQARANTGYGIWAGSSDGLAYVVPRVNINNIVLCSNDYNQYHQDGIILETSFGVISDVIYQGGYRNGPFNRMQDGRAVHLRHRRRQNPGSAPVDVVVRGLFAIDAWARFYSTGGFEGFTVEGGRGVNNVFDSWTSALEPLIEEGITVNENAAGASTFTVNDGSWLTITFTNGANTHTAVITAISGGNVTFTPALPVAYPVAGTTVNIARINSTTLSSDASSGATTVTIPSAQVFAVGFWRRDGRRHVTHVTGLASGVFTMQDACPGTVAAGTTLWIGGKEPLGSVTDVHGNNQGGFWYSENIRQVTIKNCWPYRNQNLIAQDTTLTVTAAAVARQMTLQVSDARFLTANAGRIRVALAAGGTQILDFNAVDYSTNTITMPLQDPLVPGVSILTGAVNSGALVEILQEYEMAEFNNSFAPGTASADVNTISGIIFENLSTDVRGSLARLVYSTRFFLDNVSTTGQFLSFRLRGGAQSDEATINNFRNTNTATGGYKDSTVGSLNVRNERIAAFTVAAPIVSPPTAGETKTVDLASFLDGRTCTGSGNITVASAGGAAGHGAYEFKFSARRNGAGNAVLDSYSINNSNSAAFTQNGITTNLVVVGSVVQLQIANTAGTANVTVSGNFNYMIRS